MPARVAVVFGSDSDWPVMEGCVKQLRAFGVEPHVEVMSAHRSPDRVAEFARGAEGAGVAVIIAAAGMSNALAGAVAAHTPLPVIAVPLGGGTLHGFDALLSAVQMPPGMPVATVAVGAPGATNAALLAVQILATADASLATAYRKYKSDQAAGVAKKNKALQEQVQAGRTK